MIPPPIEQQALLILEKKLGTPVRLSSRKPIGGGDINEAICLQTDQGDFFIKWNNAKRYPGMFEAEAKGLELLKEADELFIPSVIGSGTAGNDSFLLLEFVTPGARIGRFMEDFGRSLARLHKHTAQEFGLDHDNYIGSLPQSNRNHDNWPDFFAIERLEKQVKMARNAHEIDSGTVAAFERLYKHFSSIFPIEPPALIHGDLWGGNYMTSPEGKACIYDPAVYYGHREMDIGMSRLFGGFGNEFYEAYNSEYPMGKGWNERIDICNLYPLMVHVNLFGGSYAYSVKSILRRF